MEWVRWALSVVISFLVVIGLVVQLMAPLETRLDRLELLSREFRMVQLPDEGGNWTVQLFVPDSGIGSWKNICHCDDSLICAYSLRAFRLMPDLDTMPTVPAELWEKVGVYDAQYKKSGE